MNRTIEDAARVRTTRAYLRIACEQIRQVQYEPLHPWKEVTEEEVEELLRSIRTGLMGLHDLWDDEASKEDTDGNQSL